MYNHQALLDQQRYDKDRKTSVPAERQAQEDLANMMPCYAPASHLVHLHCFLMQACLEKHRCASLPHLWPMPVLNTAHDANSHSEIA
jgi:hypothetical protein